MSGTNPEWENVTPCGETQRLKVHGGWLIRLYQNTYISGGVGRGYNEYKIMSSNFIPDLNHCWELENEPV